MDYKKVKVGWLYRYVGSSEIVIKALKAPVRTWDKKDGILYCEVVVGNKEFRKGWKMNVYTSRIVCEHTNMEYTNMHTNLQELAFVELKLTNLQVMALNEISDNIVNGKDTYASNADLLSDEEDSYLRARLRNEGILVIEEKAEG